MPLFEQRKIGELVSLYSLEPRVRDVFVEGPSDQRILRWFLHEADQDAVGVHEVDSIDVPSDVVRNYGMETNKRTRQIALAMELERALGPRDVRVSVLIDSDFDLMLGNPHACTLILKTDYTSMEMYFYNEHCLNKLLTILVGGFPKQAREVLPEITGPLQEVFLVRLTSHVLGWDVGTVRLERCCGMAGDQLHFDKDLYIQRVLTSGGKAGQTQEFLEALETNRGRLKADSRCQVHGHDFLALLAWYVRHHGKSGFDERTLGRSFPLCVELNVLKEERLFQVLLERIKT